MSLDLIAGDTVEVEFDAVALAVLGKSLTVVDAGFNPYDTGTFRALSLAARLQKHRERDEVRG